VATGSDVIYLITAVQTSLGTQQSIVFSHFCVVISSVFAQQKHS